MMLRTKTGLILGGTIAVLVLSSYLFARYYVLRGYESHETQHAHQNVERALGAFASELREIRAITGESAFWDGAYSFLENRDPGFFDREFLQESSFRGRIHLLAYVNLQGEIAGLRLRDDHSLENPGKRSEVARELTRLAHLVKDQAVPQTLSGVVNFSDGPMLVAVAPVLHTTLQGPSRGALVCGRRLDAEELGLLSKSTSLELSVFPKGSPVPSDVQAVESALPTTTLAAVYPQSEIEAGFLSFANAPIVIRPLSEERIGGYSLLFDVDGHPTFVVRVIGLRHIHAQAKAALASLIGVALLGGSIFGLIMMALLEKTVLARVIGLSREVADIGRSSDFSKRLRPSGNDELAGLAISINTSLAAVEHLSETQRLSQAALQSAKEYAEKLIQTANAIVMGLDTKGKIIVWNDMAEKITGYSRSELENHDWLEVVVPKDRYSEIRKEFERLKAGGVPTAFESPIMTKSGEQRNIAWQNNVLRDHDQVVGTISFGIDITARQQAEELFRSGFENAAISMALLTPEGKFLRVNQARCSLVGYSEQEMLQTNFRAITHPDDLEADLEYTRQMLAGEIDTYQVEKRYIHKQGHIVWGLLDVSLVRDSLGQPLHLVSQIQDITARKRAEEELRQAEERFYTAFHSSPVGMAISTLSEGRYIEVNDADLRMLGYERSEVIGKTSIELGIWKNPEERSLMLKQLDGSKPAREDKVSIRTKSGKIRKMGVSVNVVRLQGEPCLLTIIRDITEQELLEQQLLQAQKMEAVGRLAAGVAHDFNNLLGVILGYSELLMEHLDSADPRRKKLEVIQRAGESAAGLTRQLLAFSRQQVLAPKILDLNAIVINLDKMLRRLIGEDIEVVTSLDPMLGKVNADPGQIEQILMNLAVNARDAMPAGGRLTIETSNIELDDTLVSEQFSIRPGSYVMLVVSDTGVGMDAETLTHIFDPFFTTKEVTKGTGLGLATVYGIVKQSGGYIWAQSERGNGAAFKICLPRVQAAAEAKGQGQSASLPRGSETILLVEDAAPLRALACEFLGSRGYTVLDSGTPVEAIRVVEQYEGPIALLITDIVMPEISGLALAEQLTAARPGMSVLYMSGYAHDAMVKDGMLESHAAYLQKPFTLNSLASKIREILDSATHHSRLV